ncbi:hypothetical protein QM294_06585 [Acinetobacter junii]|uniref:hypothetical protein n=1 Tax=Acinetobacter junii TaxID=40215 RepID=UPI0024B65366|nr:hypothetical protein [Acinetobacter junii]MDI9720486.1 hypothetical protein [Acinetobacter junii]
MVASTDIKFYVHTNTNAPQLQNAYGSMINVLDACLVNGFGSQTVSTLTASGTTVTATFGAAHNFKQYQVIKITGATQTEFNGEHRILTVPNANSITFQLAAAPSVTTATGTITASLPPLGWEKPFSSAHSSGVGGKAAYRSLNLLLPSRPFLRVVDERDPAYTATYAKYAKVGIVEDMANIDTMLGVQAPYDSATPDKNWVGTGSGTSAINGWAKWYYASAQLNSTLYPDITTPQSANRVWLLVGNTDYFYIIPSFNTNSPGLVYGFGKFKTLLNADSANNFLSCTLQYATALGMDGTAKDDYTAFTKTSPNWSVLLQRKSNNQRIPAIAKTYSNPFSSISGNSNALAQPDTQGDVLFFPVFIFEDNNVLRGVAENILNVAQLSGINDIEGFTSGDQIFISRYTFLKGNETKGQVFFNLGGIS